jgi:acyl carrier protein
MTEKEIVDKVNEFLIEEFEVSADIITPGAPLKETLDLDSLDYVDLVVIIEGNFGIKVKQEDFTTIRTFQDLYNYITVKMAQTNLA